MTLRLMDCSIHTKQDPKEQEGSSGPSAFSRTALQRLHRRNPSEHFASVQSQRALFSSVSLLQGDTALLTQNSWLHAQK